MNDVYRDTDHRYLTDPAFHAVVKMLERAAIEHGFTPGELKQMAFKAALNIEERRALHPVDRTPPAPIAADGIAADTCPTCGESHNGRVQARGRLFCSLACAGGEP